MLIDSYADGNNKGKIKAHLPLQHIPVFAKHLKIKKGLGFELQLKT